MMCQTRVVARADRGSRRARSSRARREADAARLGQLEHEHRQRPRRRERAALDRDDLRQVGVGQAADRRGGRGHASARPAASSASGSAHVLRDERVAGDRPAPSRPGGRARGADAVQRRAVRRDRRRRPARAASRNRTAPSPPPARRRRRAGRAPAERLRAPARPAPASALAAVARRRRTPRRGGRRDGEHARPPALAGAARRAPAASRPPTSSAPVACASARAVATPIRSPVNVPGPTPTAMRSTSAQARPASLEQPRARAAAAAAAWPGRSPGRRVVAALDGSRRRGRAPTTVAGVAVSKPRTAPRASPATVDARARSPPACSSRTRATDAPRAELGLGDLGPLDERDARRRRGSRRAAPGPRRRGSPSR